MTSPTSSRRLRPADERAGGHSRSHPPAERADVENALQGRPVDYFKLLRRHGAVRGGLGDRLLAGLLRPRSRAVRSDSPFDPEKGPGYTRSTIANLDGLGLSEGELGELYHGNAERLLGLTGATG
jgi:uncharacterized protein